MMLEQKAPSKLKINFKLDFRWITVFLLLVIIAMLAIWRPWATSTNDSTRTVTVTGESKVSATPDEYVFYPSYSFENADKQTAINDANTKSAEIVAKLKTLGVADSKIKTNVSGYPSYDYYGGVSGNNTYTLSLTVKVADLAMAQKVQDYLNSTAPSGTVSPIASFSDAKRKDLENQARDEASKDAKAKADKMANNLGFKLGQVKSITDGSGFGIIEPAYAKDSTIRSSSDSGTVSVQANTIQPGENDIQYSVNVVYFLK